MALTLVIELSGGRPDRIGALSGILDAAERHVRLAGRAVIDVDHAGLHAAA